MFGLLLAAVAHDVDHTGRNNDFEMKSDSDLAIQYNYQSPLENHHAFETFKILRDSDSAILEESTMDAKDKRTLRKIVIQAILSTDMTHHFSMNKQLTQLGAFDTLDFEREETSQFLINVTLHTSDLCNQAKPHGCAKLWAKSICQEFTEQHQAEVKAGFSPTPFMQNLNDPITMWKGQVGFIDFVVKPWYDGMTRLLPEIKFYQNFLTTNRDTYARYGADIDSEKKIESEVLANQDATKVQQIAERRAQVGQLKTIGVEGKLQQNGK